MSSSLFDGNGVRKYLTTRERYAFARAACREHAEVATFCLTLAFTGARISEALALTRERIDNADSALVFETLKRRRSGIYRAVPVPPRLIATLRRVHRLNLPDSDPKERLWKWGRTTAWKYVKRVLRNANVSEALTKPRAVRHGFGVGSIQNGVALNIVQRWLGHARLETTTIYAAAIGKEERLLARRSWVGVERALDLTLGTNG